MPKKRLKPKPRVVLIFGVFDLIHPGHLAFISSARRRGTVLKAVVTPDCRVEREKGRRPFFNERERIKMVTALKGVDKVRLGDKGKKWTAVERLRPDVICLGYDQRADHPKFLRQTAAMRKKPRIVRIRGARPDRYKSSRLRLEIHKSL